MTEVKAARAKFLNGGYYSIELFGHATGSDKVCAAVSGLVYALAGYLDNDTDVRWKNVDLSPGLASFDWEGGAESEGAWRMAIIGLAQLEKAEPERIKVHIPENFY